MYIVEKTTITNTQSQPDLQDYQNSFYFADPRRNQSVTLHNRFKKVNSIKNQKQELSQQLSNLSLTKQTYNGLKTLYQFTQKTITQIKSKQEITLTQNFISSMKESNQLMYKVAKKMSSFIKAKKLIDVKPKKIFGNWVNQFKSKCLKKQKPQTSQYQNHNTGFRDEDDDLIII